MGPGLLVLNILQVLLLVALLESAVVEEGNPISQEPVGALLRSLCIDVLVPDVLVLLDVLDSFPE